MIHLVYTVLESLVVYGSGNARFLAQLAWRFQKSAPAAAAAGVKNHNIDGPPCISIQANIVHLSIKVTYRIPQGTPLVQLQIMMICTV